MFNCMASEVSINLDEMEEVNTIELYKGDTVEANIVIGTSDKEVIITVEDAWGKQMHTVRLPLE